MAGRQMTTMPMAMLMVTQHMIMDMAATMKSMEMAHYIMVIFTAVCMHCADII